jgi:hypothetical protein
LFLPVALPHPPKPGPHDSPEVAELKRQLHWAYLKIQVLEERLRDAGAASPPEHFLEHLF